MHIQPTLNYITYDNHTPLFGSIMYRRCHQHSYEMTSITDSQYCCLHTHLTHLSTPYGDTVLLAYDNTFIKFYSINTYGIYTDENYGEGHCLIEALKLLHVAIWGRYEVDLNTRCPSIEYDMKTMFKSIDRETKIQLSPSPELFPQK